MLGRLYKKYTTTAHAMKTPAPTSSKRQQETTGTGTTDQTGSSLWHRPQLRKAAGAAVSTQGGNGAMHTRKIVHANKFLRGRRTPLLVGLGAWTALTRRAGNGTQ